LCPVSLARVVNVARKITCWVPVNSHPARSCRRVARMAVRKVFLSSDVIGVNMGGNLPQ
jgi:glycerol-3-phosphate dehydrogenase